MKYRLAFVLTIAALLAQLFVIPVAPVLAASYNISGASVNAEPLGTNLSGGSSTITDNNGNYVINDSIGVGQYNVTASAPGFFDQAQTATINTTSDVDNINFDLQRSGILWGRVLSPSGQPVVGAEMSLLDANNDTISTTISDSNGQYYFYTNVYTGTYSIQVDFQFNFQLLAELLEYEANATIPNFPYQSAPYLANGFVGATTGPISAAQGEVTQVPDIVLQSSGVITGTVTDANGQPVANVPVAIENQNSNLAQLVLTDSSGNYRASYDIVTDPYTVTAMLAGYVQTGAAVNATQTATTTLNLQIPRSAGLSGYVYRTSDQKPIEGATVELEGATSGDFGLGSTDANGFYSIFGNLGTDNYTLNVFAGDIPIYTGSIELTSGVNTTQDFSGNAFFVTGTVHANSTSGPGIPDAFIEASYQLFGLEFGGEAGNDGSFNIASGIPAGLAGMPVTMNLTASAPGYDDSSVLVNTTIGSDITQDFVLTPSATTITTASAAISGTVTGGSGPNLPQSTFWWISGNFEVGVQSTSDVPFIFTQTNNDSVQIYVQGPAGTSGSATVWLPDNVFKGPFSAASFPGPNPTLVSQTDNGTYTAVVLSFSNNDSEQVISIFGVTPAPEFPGVFLLAAIGSAVAVAMLYERRLRLSPSTRAQ